MVVLAVLAVLAFAARDRWRSRRLAPGGGEVGVFGDGARLPAAAYRDRARAALRTGDHDTALLDGYRAVAASADERTLLDAAPGRTAHEVAVALAAIFPSSAVALSGTADRFDAVRYGDHRATAEQARDALALDDQLLATRPDLDVVGR